jgi:flagellar protein FlaG
MKIEANTSPTSGSPQLTPRAAQAVQVAKATAARLAPEVPDRQATGVLQEMFGLTLPQAVNSRVELSVNKEAGIVVGRVINRETGEVIREIPSEEMVRLIEATKRALGPLVDMSV